MQQGEDTTEFFESKIEALGVDTLDFVTEDATYIRIQVVVRGKIKVLPNDLIAQLAKDITEYKIKKEVI